MSELTRSERAELAQAVRLRCRAARAGLDARKAQLLAEVDEQLAAEYQFDDAAWEEITRAAKEAVQEADRKVAKICHEVGIPAQFRPELTLEWWKRGANLAADRRAELRQVASSKADAMVKAARVVIDTEEARLREDLIARGLTSEEGRAFLANLPVIEVLMPPLDVKQLDSHFDTGEVDDLDI
jgi:hypothetical protein